MRDRDIERYWLTYDLDTMTLRVFIPPHIWQIIRPNISEEICRDAHAAGNIVLAYKLTPQDTESVCAKLHDIFNALFIAEVTDTSSPKRQLLDIFGLVYSASRYRGCSIYIETSLPFRQWVAGQGTKLESATCEVIRKTYCNLVPSISDDNIDCSVILGGNDFRLMTFGDCACLGYDGCDKDRLHEDRSFQLIPHNIDSAEQLLSLLAAVAYLWGIAHRELYD